MSESRAKRRKIERGEDDYLPGNITEIELGNFMTFDHLVCKPGSRLNLVIGPNGAGKSSLVCAIAIGLGGDPQLLGRASSIAAFVKRGKESGFIKITLRGQRSGDLIQITRKIDTSNKSEWLLNGKLVPKKDIKEVIRTFNIQVNNLTQFLPQDRVCEFAKLTPVQLLRETEKAVGDPQLPIQHDALIEKSGELSRLQNAVDKIRESLSQEKALNAEQERDVERVRQREELLAKVELMKKKLPWLKYDMKKSEYMEAKKQESDAKKKLEEAAKILNDLKEPINKQKQVKAAEVSICKKLSSVLDENGKRRMKLQEDEKHLAIQVRGIHHEMEDLRKQEQTRQQRIVKAKEDLLAAELELANLPLFEPPKDQIERLKGQILELRASVNKIQSQKSDLDKILAQRRASLRLVVDRLTDMENKNTKLLAALQNNGSEKIFDAYHWLQEHRHQLKREVYGPVLLEVNVPDSSHAKYLEGHVAFYIWKSFITQDSDDRDFLVRNMKSYDVPILNYVPDKGLHRGPPQISEKMHMLGIYSRLDQVFDAPAAVKDVLISQFGLEYSYIGSIEADNRADELSRLGVTDLWTPENHYRWSFSKYGGHVSASVDPVARSRLLSCSSDSGEIENLRSKKSHLEEEILAREQRLRSLQTEQREVEDEEAKIHKQREEIIQNANLEKKRQKDMEFRVSQRRNKLHSLEEEEDVDRKLEKLSDQAGTFNIQRYHHAIDIKNLLAAALSQKRTFAEKHMSTIEMEAQIRESEVGTKQQEKFALQASHHLQYCEKEVGRCRDQLADAKKFAESIAMIGPDLAKAFLEMPSTVEELEAAIHDNRLQANSILFLNQNILAEYEERQKKIQSLSERLEMDEMNLNKCLAEVDELKRRWLPTLRNLVTQINATFSRNFQEMAVAGEVLLDEHETDFGAYGVLIKVKFRQAGQLQVLSAHHQSGGERSVSTILYLVSLQDLTSCPFRVVDEINQGMDPINERKMFQQLVRAASQPNTPQCFLLTPKLLPNLEYSEACTTLTMFTGTYIGKAAELWSNGESYSTNSRPTAQARS
ncbi:Structural maintenance of chromosomes protein 5 [Dionaea muscipula]